MCVCTGILYVWLEPGKWLVFYFSGVFLVKKTSYSSYFLRLHHKSVYVVRTIMLLDFQLKRILREILCENSKGKSCAKTLRKNPIIYAHNITDWSVFSMYDNAIELLVRFLRRCTNSKFTILVLFCEVQTLTLFIVTVWMIVQCDGCLGKIYSKNSSGPHFFHISQQVPKILIIV